MDQKIKIPWIPLTDRDPGPLFIQEDTQKLLKSITRLDFEKVFRKRSVPKNDVEYK
jgi:small subunit ribosomal protein S22